MVKVSNMINKWLNLKNLKKWYYKIKRKNEKIRK